MSPLPPSNELSEHAAIWNNRAKVVAGNLADTLHALPNNSANVILASFSIHHFATGAKIALLADCHRVLAPGGTFIWIDAVRHDNESREAYLRRLTHEMDRDWTALSPSQRAAGCAHVREADFPETETWMKHKTEAAGFKCGATILDKPYFNGWLFEKR